MNEVLLILLLTAFSCSFIGVFLVLRNLSMITDAISHSVLLGIVLAYFMVSDLSSPFLFLGAAVFGVLTVVSIELLLKTKRLKEDAAVGIVFPLFFSAAVILLSRYARNVHLCADTVLMGEVIMASFQRVDFMGFDIPLALRNMIVVSFINVSFILLFFKELKVSAFDREYAVMAGFSLPFLHYGLMSLVSVTSVVAFDAVGTVLVISFLVAPAAAAISVTKKLWHTLIVAPIYGMVNTLIGFYLAVAWNVNIAGMVALIAGLTYFLTVLFRKDGMVTRAFRRNRQRHRFYSELLLIHIGNHGGSPDEEEELGQASIERHLRWNHRQMERYTKLLQEKREIYLDPKKNIYGLTDRGREKYASLRAQYRLD